MCMSADILGTNCDQYLSMVQTAEFQEGEEEEDDAELHVYVG